jgi:hypothetical protein
MSSLVAGANFCFWRSALFLFFLVKSTTRSRVLSSNLTLVICRELTYNISIINYVTFQSFMLIKYHLQVRYLSRVGRYLQVNQFEHLNIHSIPYNFERLQNYNLSKGLFNLNAFRLNNQKLKSDELISNRPGSCINCYITITPGYTDSSLRFINTW